MTNVRSRRLRQPIIALFCAALSVAGCGGSTNAIDPPSDTPGPASQASTSSTAATDEVPGTSETRETSPADPDMVEPIEPILSSALDDDEFEEGVTSLFNVQRIIDTDDLRSTFVERAGGPAERLDAVDLASQFIVVATTGQCVIPTTPPTLEIGVDDAAVVDVEADGGRECYRPLTVVHFFAVDDEYRDRFPLAIADLAGVISSTDTLRSDEVTPEFLDQVTAPTFVESDADYAALAPEVTDQDSRARVTSFAHQAKLLVPVEACVPDDVTVRVRLFEVAALEIIDPAGPDCDVDEPYIVVFSLGDGVRDQLRSTAPSTWSDGLAGDSTIVTPSGPQSIFVGPAATGERFDDLETVKFSTPESLAGSALDTDFGVEVSSADVDLDTRFLVAVVRRDCSVLSDGNGIIIGADSWQISPPVPDTLDCDEPNVSIMTYVIDRQYLGLFDDVPEGRR